jgi:ATP-dependent Clp protease ATP-binding subunit ClpC
MEPKQPVEPDHSMQFSAEFRDLMRESRLLALRLGNAFITSNHFLSLMLDGENPRVQSSLRALGVPADEVKEEILASCRARGTGEEIDMGNVPLTIEAEAILKQAVAEFVRRQGEAVGTEHMLLAMAHNTDSDASKSLSRFGFSYNAVVQAMEE